MSDSADDEEWKYDSVPPPGTVFAGDPFPHMDYLGDGTPVGGYYRDYARQLHDAKMEARVRQEAAGDEAYAIAIKAGETHQIASAMGRAAAAAAKPSPGARTRTKPYNGTANIPDLVDRGAGGGGAGGGGAGGGGAGGGGGGAEVAADRSAPVNRFEKAWEIGAANTLSVSKIFIDPLTGKHRRYNGTAVRNTKTGVTKVVYHYDNDVETYLDESDEDRVEWAKTIRVEPREPGKARQELSDNAAFVKYSQMVSPDFPPPLVAQQMVDDGVNSHVVEVFCEANGITISEELEISDLSESLSLPSSLQF